MSIRIYKNIEINVQEENATDYHDLVLKVLGGLCIRLYGGYYEPLSDRDVELANELREFLAQYKKTL